MKGREWIFGMVGMLICLSISMEVFAAPRDGSGASKPVPNRDRYRDSAVAEQGSTPNSGYRVGGNDVIKVQVFGEDALTTETRVSGDGKIVLSLLGVLDIQGLTVKQLEELIETRLADGYLKEPRVSVYIVRYRNIFVSGEVRSPGGYPYEDGLTVLKAITLAGGFTDKASQGRTKIKRKRTKADEEETLSVNLDDPVLPDDIIVVPQSFF